MVRAASIIGKPFAGLPVQVLGAFAVIRNGTFSLVD
jgi:hypothetical protein